MGGQLLLHNRDCGRRQYLQSSCGSQVRSLRLKLVQRAFDVIWVIVLQHPSSRWQCAIPLATGSVLLTGGEGYPGYLNYVAEYEETGFTSYWPSLRESRRSHGCGVVGEVSGP